jgi:hypothetical protein
VWPASDVTLTVIYQPRLPILTSANTVVPLLTTHPDLYLFGSLMFAEGYTMNDQRAANFEALWTGALEETKQFLGRQRRLRAKLPAPAVIA